MGRRSPPWLHKVELLLAAERAKIAARASGPIKNRSALSAMDSIARQCSGSQASTSGRSLNSAARYDRLFSSPLIAHRHHSGPDKYMRYAPERPRTAAVISASTLSSNSASRFSARHSESMLPPAAAALASSTSPEAATRGISSSARPASALPALEQREMDTTELLPSLSEAQNLNQYSVVALNGTVQKVNYRSEQTAYTVLRIALDPKSAADLPTDNLVRSNTGSKKRGNAYRTDVDSSAAKPPAPARKKRPMVTVVGTFQKVVTGQAVRVVGAWTTHHQYGLQLKANELYELETKPTEDVELVDYLAGGILPGVGPVMAQRMVNRWKSEIIQVLDAPFDAAVRDLTQVQGIGRAKAEGIKAGWDAGRHAREGSMFLREAGVPAALAQRIAESLGHRTQEVVTSDPYRAMGSFGMSLMKLDRVAAQVGAPTDLVSRGAAAIERCLKMAAEGNGHTYLPWSRLEREVQRMLADLARQNGNEWTRPDLLHLVAQHMHHMGTLIAEPAIDANNIMISSQHSNDPEPNEIQSSFGPTAAQMENISLPPTEELRLMVAQRVPSASAAQLSSMFAEYGTDLPAVLNAATQDAVGLLLKCKKIGPKSAAKIKFQWDASSSTSSASTFTSMEGVEGSFGGPAPARFGMRVHDLESTTMQGSLPFPWNGDVRCYLPTLHAAEKTVASVAGHKASLARPTPPSRLKRIRDWVEANQDCNGMELSQGQRAAIEAASDAPILVITGGPGCGKTTVVQAIVKLWCAQGKLVRICAPTGRAAQRMGVIQANEPSTIHRLLKYQPRRGASSMSTVALDSKDAGISDADDADVDEGGFFEFHARNRLPCDAVLVDEASMLSLSLAAALLQALRPKTQLILVGDVDQLPPVGPGGVLHSLIESKIAPVVNMREVFRQAAASSIVTSALAVRNGDVPRLLPAVADPSSIAQAGSDALIVRAPTQEFVPDVVYRTVAALAGSVGFVEGDLQVITPMRKGPVGSVALNPKLQEILNPPVRGQAELPRGAHVIASGDGGLFDETASLRTQKRGVFRVGDRVLQLVNNYDKDVFNGDQGYVVEASAVNKRLVVEFPATSGRSAEHANVSSNGEERGAACVGAVRMQNGRRRVEYQGMDLSQLELAYAITVHKAQGGEARHVIMALSPHHGRLLTRQMLYTGLTRARELLVVVAPSGEVDPVELAVQRCGETRLTSLSERLEAERLGRNLEERVPQVFSNEMLVLNNDTNTLREPFSPNVSEFAQKAHLPDAFVALPMHTQLASLCAELGVEENTAASLGACSALFASSQSGSSLASADEVRSYLAQLENVVGSHAFPDVSGVLSAAPLLLKASPEYFQRSLGYCARLGPLEQEQPHETGVYVNESDDSLVDQLRRLLYFVGKRTNIRCT